MSAIPFIPIAQSYDRLNDFISLGLHRVWKRRLVNLLLRLKPQTRGDFLDVATGTGDLVKLFHARRRGEKIIGLDPSAEMLTVARRRLPQSEWIQAAAETLPVKSESVTVLTCAFGVRNFDNRAQAFREWKRVLMPDAVVGVIEIHPVGEGWLRGVLQTYWKHFVPWLGQIWGQRPGYEYLRDSGAGFLSPQAMRAEIASCGLELLYSTSLFPCGMVSLSVFRNAKRTEQAIPKPSAD